MRPKAIFALSSVILGLLPACSAGAQARSYAAPARSMGDMSMAVAREESNEDALTASGGEEDGISLASTPGGGLALGLHLAEGNAAPAPPPPPPAGSKKDQAPPKEAPGTQTAPSSEPTGKKLEGDGTVAVMRAPMLVYTARVNMAVYEVKSSLGEVESLARSLGGFLARRNDQSITIRVPATRFDEAIRRIEKLGDMLSRDVQVEDVTEEFHDTEIRLKNARAVRERLEQLLAKATKVEESIQIEKELERVAETIDRLEGRMKFLRDRAAFSTITVTFQPQSSAELGKRRFNLPVPWIYELGLGRLLSL
ncbi:DUF4349 domain-containing protein [Polyangium mundeleinium]|uniref:DUF4349 domain-containing protein n=1 Tax=Polyangium mundeleinium TaxID=2995306 RepID=A0ABT5EQK9_9BACT|nr:DUF4349 domain-containing protein [Polyangium mundeleinium]MDC0743624.1 DUF4349 domain-containing protein [Polyangium mundeleinium]